MIIVIELIQKEKDNCVDLFIGHADSPGAKAYGIPKDSIGEAIQSYYDEFVEDKDGKDIL